MKFLPNLPQDVVKVASLRKRIKNPDFPSINRFITEDILSVRTLQFTKVLLISALSVLVLLLIIFQSIALRHNITQAQEMQAERQKINGEISYWKTMAQQYNGYRDIYFRIAQLEYKMGNMEESKNYVKKAMELDPNFEAGKVLGVKIEGTKSD